MAYIYYGMNIDPAKRRQSAPTFLENADAPFGSSSQLKVPDNFRRGDRSTEKPAPGFQTQRRLLCKLSETCITQRLTD